MNNMPLRPEPMYAQFSELKALIRWLDENKTDYEEQKFLFPSMLSVKVFTGQLNAYGRKDAVTFMQIKGNGGEDGPILCRLPGEEKASEVTISEAKVLSEQFSGKLPFPEEYRDAQYEQALDKNISLTSELRREITRLTNECTRRMGLSQGNLTKSYVLAEKDGYSITYDPVANVLLAGTPDGPSVLSPNSPPECFSLFTLAKQNLEKGKMNYVRNSKSGQKLTTKTLEQNNKDLSERSYRIHSTVITEIRRKPEPNPQPVLPFSVANNGPDGIRVRTVSKARV